MVSFFFLDGELNKAQGARTEDEHDGAITPRPAWGLVQTKLVWAKTLRQPKNAYRSFRFVCT